MHFTFIISYGRLAEYNMDDVLLQEAKIALEGVPSIQAMSKKQLEYILKVCNYYNNIIYSIRQ